MSETIDKCGCKHILSKDNMVIKQRIPCERHARLFEIESNIEKLLKEARKIRWELCDIKGIMWYYERTKGN